MRYYAHYDCSCSGFFPYHLHKRLKEKSVTVADLHEARWSLQNVHDFLVGLEEAPDFMCAWLFPAIRSVIQGIWVLLDDKSVCLKQWEIPVELRDDGCSSVSEWDELSYDQQLALLLSVPRFAARYRRIKRPLDYTFPTIK